MFISTILLAALTQPPAPAAQVRLIVKLDLAAISEAPLVRKNAAKWQAWADDWAKALLACGCASGEARQLWFFAGEDFPRGSVIRLVGGVDVKKAEERLARQARDKRWGTRQWGDESPWLYSLEIPVAANPIPGLPNIAYVSADSGDLLIGFDKDAIGWARVPRETSNRELLEGSAVAAVLEPPASMTAPGGLFAGVKALKADIRVHDNIEIRIDATPADGTAIESLAERTRAFLEQSRRNFPLLAGQQGVNPRLVTFFGDLLSVAQVRVQDGRVEVTAELSGELVSKLIGR